MSSEPTQPTQPLDELGDNSAIESVLDDGLEDEEEMWQRRCAAAGVPEVYKEPSTAESSKVAKQVNKAKRKRQNTMREAIRRAKAAAAAAASAERPAAAFGLAPQAALGLGPAARRAAGGRGSVGHCGSVAP